MAWLDHVAFMDSTIHTHERTRESRHAPRASLVIQFFNLIATAYVNLIPCYGGLQTIGLDRVCEAQCMYSRPQLAMPGYPII